VGSVVGLREQLNWFEHRPLFGQRIVITRPRDEARHAAATLEALGAEVLLAPTVEVRPITDTGPLDQAIDRLADYQWLVFTSANGVRFFFERLEQKGRDLRAVGHIKLAAIGPTTAEALAQFHLRADLIPESYRSESLAEALGQHARGCRVLLARADRGRAVLKEELQPLAEVDQVAVYHNADVESIPDEVSSRILEATVDCITLTSSDITSRLHALLHESGRHRVGRDVRLASLSPVTSETATRLGWDVAAEATEFTWDGLVRAIVEQVAADRNANHPPATSSSSNG
jgi:uroporphyrinogen III methyltransferase/synthase